MVDKMLNKMSKKTSSPIITIPAAELKRGQVFTIYGKRKKYTIEDIIRSYSTITIYHRVSVFRFIRVNLSPVQMVIIHKQ